MPELTLTAKLKLIDVSHDDLMLFDNTINVYTEALNYVSELVTKEKLYHSSFATIQKLAYKDVRNKYGLLAQVTCSVFRTVKAKYASLIANKQLFNKDKTGKPITKVNTPKFKPKEIDLVYNKDYSFTKDGMVNFSTLEGRRKYKFYSKGYTHFFDGTWTYGQAKLKKVNNEYYIYVSFTKEIDSKTLPNTVGVDVGLNFLAVSYNGTKTTFYSGKKCKEYRAHYKKLRQELQAKNTRSSKRRLVAINNRENRFINDVNHCIAKALVLNNPNSLFIVEDLSNIRPALAKVKKEDRYYMVSWSYGDLLNKLTYKASLHGSLVKRVDPSYTSQTCPICGHKEKDNRNRKEHLFKCKKCSYSSNDDRIGAMNLYNKRVEIA